MQFTLQPFDKNASELALSGTVTRHNNQLAIAYTLTGDLEALVIAPPAESPERRDNLWETTCFEFFFAVPNTKNYHEVNLSPAGHWNLYRFDDYRAAMRHEPSLTTLPFTVTQTDRTLTLALALDLNLLLNPNQPLELSITAVLQNKNSDCTYWATAHTGQNPDFHRRDSFVLRLD
jgi:hypothetical protein